MRQRIRDFFAAVRAQRAEMEAMAAEHRAAVKRNRAAKRKEAEDLARRRKLYGLAIGRATALATRPPRRHRSMFGRA